MPTTITDEHGHVRSYVSVSEPETPLKHLADVRKEMDLGFMCEDWHTLSVLDLYGAALGEPMTLYVVRGTEPLVREERKLLRKHLVRDPREWIGTVTYTPRDGFATLSGEAYGPKGLEQMDEDRGRMVLVDENDSLVLMANLLHETMRRSDDDVRVILHRAEKTVRYEQLQEETDAP